MKNKSENLKLIFYYLILIAIIVSINSGGFEIFLNWVVGVAWSKPIIDILKSSSQGLIILLLLSIYLNFVKNDSKKYMDKIKRIEDILTKSYWEKSDKKEILRNILKQKLGDRYDVSNIISSIFTEKIIYNDVELNFKLENISTNNDKYLLTTKQIFKAEISEFIFAFTHDVLIETTVKSICPKINDIFVFSDMESMKNITIDIINDKVSFICISKSNGGTTNSVSCPFLRIPNYKTKKYLGKFKIEKENDIVLIKAKIPKNCRDSYFKLQYIYTMSKLDHYFFWTADRIQFLKTINIDVSSFSFSNKDRYIFQPFIMNMNLSSYNKNISDSFSLDIHNWVLNSQGFIFTWR